MILDADLDRSAFATPFDVCVIGAGPAGITLARRLAAQGARVALMEGGGLDYSDRSQALYAGTNAGLDYHDLDICRLRFLGGSSNHWGGWCRALDPWDFLPKSWNPMSGWPIRSWELDPWRDEADAILDIPPASAWPDRPLQQDTLRFDNVRFRWSPPTVFGEKYRPELEASDRIVLALNANLVDLRLDDAGTAVTEARFRGYDADDPGFSVSARHFCLATGGIENARLLLNFRSPQQPGGIGNANDLVGRYFCEHPHFVIGEMLLTGPLYWHIYAPSWNFMIAEEILNFGLRLEPTPPPAGMFAALARDAEPPRTFRLDPGARQPDPDWIAPRLARNLAATSTGPLRIAQEQALQAGSRVTLGPETDVDALGLRRPVLDWHLDDLDVHTMRTAVLALGAHFAEQGLGRVRMSDWLAAEDVRFPGVDEDIVGGMHHMGTTRMADDPRHGVVDRDCRVYGIDNLFVGGSSVFATPGHANPTYTIVQLAVRLADHITGRLRG